MKLDPINPAPPVTKIVFSISSNFGFGSTRPLATPPPGERTANVIKKDGIHPVLLLTASILSASYMFIGVCFEPPTGQSLIPPVAALRAQRLQPGEPAF